MAEGWAPLDEALTLQNFLENILAEAKCSQLLGVNLKVLLLSDPGTPDTGAQVHQGFEFLQILFCVNPIICSDSNPTSGAPHTH